MATTNSWKYLKGTTSKYHAVRTEVDGINFASKKEAKRYQELKLLERVHEIKSLKLQVPFPIIPKSKYGREIRYVADFVYITKDGEMVIEDTKGYETDVFKLKARMVAEQYGIEIKKT